MYLLLVNIVRSDDASNKVELLSKSAETSGIRETYESPSRQRYALFHALAAGKEGENKIR